MRPERVVPPRGGAMDENSETRLVENVHPIVARDGIRADTDANPGVDNGKKRGDPVAELGVRRRAVRNRTSVARHDLQCRRHRRVRNG